MTTYHPIAVAFPEGGATTADDIRQKSAGAFPLTLKTATEIQTMDFTAANFVALPWMVIVNAVIFIHDPADGTSAHDGVTTLVSQDGRRYIAEISPGPFVNVLSITSTPPGGAVIGDKHIVGSAPSGDFATNADELAVLTSRGWEFAAPLPGQIVYVRDIKASRLWSENATWDPLIATGSIGPTSLVWPFGAVVEQETALPPADLIAQGTGAAIGDLTENGGLAAAFDGTESQTAAASAAKSAVTSAYAGKTYGAATALAYATVIPSNDDGFSSGSETVTLELYGKTGAAPTGDTDGTLLGSVGSFADTTGTINVGSNDQTTTWDHVWVRIVLSGAAGIRLAEVKFYSPAIVAAGTLYLVAVSAIGAWSGQDGNIAEADGLAGWLIHTAYVGARIHDQARVKDYQWDGTIWRPASGDITRSTTVYSSSDLWVKPSNLVGVYVEAYGGGGGGGQLGGGSSGATGGTTSFGTHVSASGGLGGNTTDVGSGGVGTGGDVNAYGDGGFLYTTVNVVGRGGSAGGPHGGVGGNGTSPSRGPGGGGAGISGNGAGGGGGGFAGKWIDEAQLASNEVITIGGGGSGGSGAQNGTAGQVVVTEYLAV